MDQVIRSRGIRDRDSLEVLEDYAVRLGGDEARRAAITKQERAQDHFQVSAVLQVQGAELQVDDEDSRARLRPDDVARELEGVHGGRTAHETHQGALDRGVEPEPLNELLVEPRCREPGAGRDDQMRDIGPLIVNSKRVDAAQRQLHRLGLEAPHAGGGAGEIPGDRSRRGRRRSSAFRRARRWNIGARFRRAGPCA